MKKLFISNFLLLFTFGILAQSRSEKSVAAALEQLRIAMIDGNKEALEAITSGKLSYGHSNGYVEGKSEFVEKIVSGKSDFVTIEIKDQVIEASGKTAVVRHVLHATTNDGGRPGEVHLKILLIWQKKSGKWKLLARQAVKVS